MRPAHAAVQEIEAGGGRAIAVRADVADAADVERRFQEAANAFGHLDVVVHTAGIMPLSPIAAGGADGWRGAIVFPKYAGTAGNQAC